MGAVSPQAKRNRVIYNQQYNDMAYDRLAIRVPKGTRDSYKLAADRLQLSLAGFVQAACNEYISKHLPKD